MHKPVVVVIPSRIISYAVYQNQDEQNPYSFSMHVQDKAIASCAQIDILNYKVLMICFSLGFTMQPN
jgi:hypothetical protein